MRVVSLEVVIQAVVTGWPSSDVYGHDSLLFSIGQGVSYDRGGAPQLNLLG